MPHIQHSIRLLKALPMMSWMMFIFWASHQTATEINDQSWISHILSFIGQYFPADKIVHGLVYGILGALGTLVFTHRPWLNWTICVLYGMSDEFHQSFIPSRSVEAMDVLADAFGAGLAILMISRILVYRHQNNSDLLNPPV